jgi:hypothetical protein
MVPTVILGLGDTAMVKGSFCGGTAVVLLVPVDVVAGAAGAGACPGGGISPGAEAVGKVSSPLPEGKKFLPTQNNAKMRPIAITAICHGCAAGLRSSASSSSMACAADDDRFDAEAPAAPDKGV